MKNIAYLTICIVSLVIGSPCQGLANSSASSAHTTQEMYLHNIDLTDQEISREFVWCPICNHWYDPDSTHVCR